MIAKVVFVITLLLISMIMGIVSRAIIKKQTIFGKPPVPVFFFVLAKMFVLVNLAFLFLKGLNIRVENIFVPGGFMNMTGLILLIIGTVVLFISTISLNNDLIFGLSSSDSHKLRTRGIYSLSRHPFYLGFIFILISSCLFNPHIINILAFIGAWLIHHVIMIKEEQFLTSMYGEEYIQYTKKVNRYITLNT